MGYHIAVTDLRRAVARGARDAARPGHHLVQALHGLQGRAMVDDETLFRTMEVAADTGALVMVHAENGDAIDVLVKQALAEGNTEPKCHALTRPPETEGEATNRAIQLARVAGCPLYVVHVSCREAVEPIALARRRAGTSGARRAPSTSSSTTRSSSGRTSRARSTCTRRRRGRRRTRSALGRRAHRRALGDLDRPLRVPLGRPEVAGQGRLLEDPERRAGAREPAAHDPRVRRPRRPDLAEPDGRAARDEPGEAVRALPAQGHDRGRLRRRHRRLRPREAGTRSRPRRTTRRRTTTSTRAPR